jgi:eukaryotic-like serine/threonine-protein kinase
MKESPTRYDRTVDQPLSGPPPTVCEEFEAAWRGALSGGPAPTLDNFLGPTDGLERADLRRRLEEIEQRYRGQLDTKHPRRSITPAIGSGDSLPTIDAPLDSVPPEAGRAERAKHPTLSVDSNGAAAQAALADTSFELSPQSQAGPAGYEILRVVGRGGMGVVYEARQVALKRRVALKMVSAGIHAGDLQLARFQTEAEAVARLDHPNIVRIYEVGEHASIPFISLEFVEGGSLEEKLAGRPLPAREAAGLAQTLSQAVHYAHEQGVVHRDLKPANVLLAADGTPKISDFGLAKRIDDVDSSHTRAGTVVGTPSYMAPEQADGDVQAVGPLSDVYALGAVLYELLTGRPPFKGATLLDTLDQVRTREPVPVRQLQPKVPRDLETVCLKCLQKEPRERYSSAGALAADLRRFLEDRPVQARPAGRAERAWRWCRKNPRAAALTAVVAALVVSVGALLTAAAVRSGRERAAVAQARQLASSRLEQARQVVAAGDFRRAEYILDAPDALVESSPDLADVRAEREGLVQQVAAFADFKRRVDQARYAGLFGGRATATAPGPATPQSDSASLPEAQRLCRDVLELHEALQRRAGEGGQALPALDEVQEQIVREDVFDTLLIAAQVEWNLCLTAGNPEARPETARRVLGWLERAESLLPATRVLHARRAFYRGVLSEPEAAREEQRQAEAITPRTAVDHFWIGVDERLLGEAARARGDSAAAQRHFRQAMAEYAALLRIRPDHFWGYFEWANCQVRLGSPQDALIAFTACTHIRPDAPWPYFNRGTTHLQLKQYDEAAQDFDQALRRDPGYAAAFLNRGLTHALQGQHAAAVTDYDQAVATRADGYPLARFQRAQSYRALERHREARDDYAAVLRLEPDRGDCYLGRGFMNLLLKDFDAALDDLREAARLLPKNEMPHYLAGVIHLGRRNYDRALPALERAIELKPTFPKPYLARAQIRHWQGRPEEALTDINLVLDKLAPEKLAGILNDRADLYRSLGRLDDAAADYRRAIELEPKNEHSYVGLALVCGKQGKPEEALATHDRLVAADRGSVTVYLRRAEHYRDRGEFEEAFADCDRAADRNRDGSALPGLVRASALAARGDHARATTDADRLLRQAPPGDGHALYTAACVWGLASNAARAQPGSEQLAKQYADRAVVLVAEVLEKGFHDLLYEEHNRMLDDPALAALHDHPRFRELFGRRLK